MSEMKPYAVVIGPDPECGAGREEVRARQAAQAGADVIGGGDQEVAQLVQRGRPRLVVFGWPCR